MEHKTSLQYEKRGEELAFQGAAIQVYKDFITLPNGREVTWDLVKHPGGAGVLPIDEEHNVLLVRQYRNAVGDMVLEIPAGKREGQEPFLQCAARELEEEIGYRSDHIVHLSNSIPAIGYSNEILGLFYADHLEKTNQHLDEDEFISVVRLPFEQVLQMVCDGKIIDSKTVTAVLLYQQVLLRSKTSYIKP